MNRKSIGFFWILLVILLVFWFLPEVTPYGMDEQNVGEMFSSPSRSHFFGTDSLGRDVFSRFLFGARVSLSVGVMSAFIVTLMGLSFGCFAGWFGGMWDRLLMFFAEVLQSLPNIAILILLKIFFDGHLKIESAELRATVGILLAIGLSSWVNLARVVRGQVMVLKQSLFIEASIGLGATSMHIIKNHLLPNIWGPMAAMIVYQIPSNILFESFLSFIGLGLQPPYSSWGVMAREGWNDLEIAPYVLMAPCLGLFLIVFALSRSQKWLKNS